MIRKIEIDLAPEEWRELETEAQLIGLSLEAWLTKLLQDMAAVPEEGKA